MHKNILRVIGVSAFTLFIPLSALAAAGDVEVTVVSDELSNAIGGATVQIQCAGGTWTHFGTTTAAGAIAAAAPPGGANCNATEALDIRITSSTGYVSKTVTGAITYSTTTDPNSVSVTGVLFMLKIVVADELGTSLTADSVRFGGNAESGSSGGTYYFARSGSSLGVLIAKDGYVSASTTNTGLSDVSTATSGQTLITLGAYSATSSAVAASSSVTVKGLEFGQKVTVTESGGGAVTPTSVTAGSANTSCTIVGNIAYCAVPVAQDGGSGDVLVRKLNYQNGSGSTGDRTSGASAQEAVAVSITRDIGGGSVWYQPAAIPAPATPLAQQATVAPAPTPVPSSVPVAPAAQVLELQAQVTALLEQLQMLIAQATARGISIPPGIGTLPVAGFQFTRDLSLGSVGNDVRELQRYLNRSGFTVAQSGPGSPGGETERFGYATLAAVKKLQQAAGISTTGYFGPLTRAYVNSQ